MALGLGVCDPICRALQACGFDCDTSGVPDRELQTFQYDCKAPVATSTLGSNKNPEQHFPNKLERDILGNLRALHFCSPGSLLLSLASWGLWVTGALQSFEYKLARPLEASKNKTDEGGRAGTACRLQAASRTAITVNHNIADMDIMSNLARDLTKTNHDKPGRSNCLWSGEGC